MNRQDFEIKAIVAGLTQKDILDFTSAFRAISGNSIESPIVDKEYLQKEGPGIAIAVRAILDKSSSKESIAKMIDFFESLYN
jgi:hypothetical protein